VLELLLGAALAGPPQTGPAAHVVFTGSNRGELKPCGCPGAIYGGLAKRAVLFKVLAEEEGSFARIDAGDLFFPEGPVTSVNRGPREAKARRIAEIMLQLDYDAAIIGRLDSSRASAELLADPMVVELTTLPTRPIPAGERGAIRVARLDAQGGDSVPTGSEPLILLTDLTDDAIAAALVRVEEPWIVVSSSPDATLSEPMLTWVGDVPVVRPTPKGKEYGELWLWSDTATDRKMSELRVDGESTRAWLLASGERRIELRFTLIPRDTPDEPDIAELIELAENDAVRADKGEPWQEWEGQTYTGVAACVGCHPSQTRKWETTAHARAWAVLEHDGSEANIDCVACHSTGFGQEGGFLRPASAGALTDVQCEVCHGPSLAHVYSPHTVPPPQRRPVESTCMSCHQWDRSRPFDFEAWLPIVQCPPSPK